MSENMEKVYDVIVVGSGPAGAAAGGTGRRGVLALRDL